MSKVFRIIVLGAGFSRSAGLPLGTDLFQEARRSITSHVGRDNKMEADLDRYIRYLNRCEGKNYTAESIDYELFLGFLDVEHFLGLKGKDTWSDEGNESQLMIRQAIAKVLYEHTPDAPPAIYREFAKRLDLCDMVLTFNYDTILESALEQEGVGYRLFPNRYSKIGWGMNTVDDSKDEVVVLKLHGSINWFDKAVYDRAVARGRTYPEPYEVKHPVFGNQRIVDSRPITDGPRDEGDPLASIYQVSNLERVLNWGFWECCPLILAPSQTKLFYSQPLRDFWWGIQRAGGLNLGLGVIGYSLPSYDAYARQALYHVFSNYTGYAPDLEMFGRKKGKIRIIDMRPPGDSGAEIRGRYRFADWGRTDLWLDGFNHKSLDWFFAA